VSGGNVDLDEVKAYLSTRIARHKVPKHWLLLVDFPRNPSGKIQKFELQRQFEQSAE
jgi:acyl-coenzyme A synthetase/AMP-(fatty) acid ligase